MSYLIEHAKRELELINEEPEVVQGYLDMIQVFVDLNPSGGMASVFIPTLNALLKGENLAPLTDDPREWVQVSEDLWQNKRNSAVLSNDGGETYWNVDSLPHNRPEPA